MAVCHNRVVLPLRRFFSQWEQRAQPVIAQGQSAPDQHAITMAIVNGSPIRTWLAVALPRYPVSRIAPSTEVHGIA